MDDRKSYLESVDREINDWKARMDGLLADAEKRRKQIDSSFHKDIEALKRRQDDVQQEVRRLYELNDTPWDKAIQSVNRALAEIRKAFDDLAARHGGKN
jgi:predicted  nucleic acid-binding Zn-ribbon protein